MDQNDALAEHFEANRPHLRSVAYRMLSSNTEAEDALQEAWLRISRADAAGVQNPAGWLTTVVARVCLDMLRARSSRREEPEETALTPETGAAPLNTGPEHKLILADSISLALLVVLETLTPPERLAFVLHDMFDLPFEEIASILDCSSAAARQLASRARRRVQGAPAREEAAPDRTQHRRVVEAFLLAAREGDLSGLLAALDPAVVVRPDRAAMESSAANQAKGAPKLTAEVRGATSVADAFVGRAKAAQPALINGVPGAVWAPGGTPRVAYQFQVLANKIVSIDVTASSEVLAQLSIEILR